MNQDTDFVTELGRPFLAHRLRRLSEMFVDGYAKWLPKMGVTSPPRALSTLLLLEREGALGITEIAARLRLSHPLVIKLTGALEAEGLTEVENDPGDGRRRLITLSPAGRWQAAIIGRAVRALDLAYAELARETGIDLIEGCIRAESACLALSFEERLARAAVEITQKEDVKCV